MTRRVGRLSAGFTSGLLATLLLTTTAGAGGGAARAAGPGPGGGYENLAAGKPATADASQGDDLGPGKANDGDPDTRWCPPDGEPGHWWRVDLGRPEALTGASVRWEFDGKAYRYKLEGSADGRTWNVLADRSENPERSREQTLAFTAPGVRYVRLTATGLEEGAWGSIAELAVFGTKPAAAKAQAKAKAAARGGEAPASAEAILTGVKAPEGWDVTLFAAPPDVSYPTCLAAAPTGEVFVGVDENGSLDAKPGRGRVVRCVDADGDGRADRFTVFAEMDSPRGLAYDASTSTLYVQHPPYITAHHDDNGDGVADREEVLVKGIGFDLNFRGADHTTNGIRLAVDGYLYVAVGDYGFMKAVGKDGATRQLRGGGIARVRPDGTGLEVYSRGQRNIYDVAIDPFMNIFTRDNTNDGGGWDVRLSHVIPTAQMGYPTLFTNFNDEIVPPLADYGGGSPCGSLYLHEPGFPAGFGDTLYTCEWGRGGVFRHPLTRNGAGFKAGQEAFLEMPRPTDMDVDGSGRVFVSSWKDGGFTFSGPNVGYVVRVTPPGGAGTPFPDLKAASDEALVDAVGSAGAVLRLAAQREILKRGDKPAFARGLGTLAVSADRALAGRVAAVYTLALLKPHDPALLFGLAAARNDLVEFVVRAATDPKAPLRKEDNDAVAACLTSADPRVRLQAVVALARLGRVESAPAVVKLTADPDPLVAHAAVNALVALDAVDACLAAIGPKTPALAAGAARALQALHEAAAVDGLIEKLAGAKEDATRRPVLKALCRLYNRESAWDGRWWGTRPDTSGPYYYPETWGQSEKIGQTLRSALGGADDREARWLLAEMLRNKVELEGTTERALKLASSDPAFRAATVGLLANRPNLPAAALALLGEVAASDRDDPSLRAKALRGLSRSGDPAARALAVAALAAVGRLEAPPGELRDAWQAFVRDNRQARDVGHYVALAEGPDAAPAEVAYAVILQADASPRGQARSKQVARDAIARAWAEPALSARLLHAVGRTRSQSYAAQVRERLTSPVPAVRLAAADAARLLGIDRPGQAAGPLIAKLPVEAVLAAAVKEPGDPAAGAALFERQSCVNCHTVVKSEAPKGPYLGDIANRYSRAELAESILKPSAKIAQGFETQKFATLNGQTYEGFVTRESGTEVEIRTANGSAVVIPKAEIEERGKSEISVMPTGAVDNITPADLASILSYLESLKAKAGP